MAIFIQKAGTLRNSCNSCESSMSEPSAFEVSPALQLTYLLFRSQDFLVVHRHAKRRRHCGVNTKESAVRVFPLADSAATRRRQHGEPDFPLMLCTLAYLPYVSCVAPPRFEAPYSVLADLCMLYLWTPLFFQHVCCDQLTICEACCVCCSRLRKPLRLSGSWPRRPSRTDLSLSGSGSGRVTRSGTAAVCYASRCISYPIFTFEDGAQQKIWQHFLKQVCYLQV